MLDDGDLADWMQQTFTDWRLQLITRPPTSKAFYCSHGVGGWSVLLLGWAAFVAFRVTMSVRFCTAPLGFTWPPFGGYSAFALTLYFLASLFPKTLYKNWL